MKGMTCKLFHLAHHGMRHPFMNERISRTLDKIMVPRLVFLILELIELQLCKSRECL